MVAVTVLRRSRMETEGLRRRLCSEAGGSDHCFEDVPPPPGIPSAVGGL